MFPQTIADVAVLTTGLLRTLLSPPVLQSFRRHIATPLGNRLDLFIVIILHTATNRTYLHREIIAGYARATLAMMPWQGFKNLSCRIRGSRVDWGSVENPRDPAASAKLKPIDQDEWPKTQQAIRVLVQWQGVRKAYAMVEAAEASPRRSGIRYGWLLRTRTDIVYLEDVTNWLAVAADRVHAYVPKGGMNAFDVAMCQNDHLFLCPRQLCRPYFHLLELWESPLCREYENYSSSKLLDSSTSSIFATRDPTTLGGYSLGQAQFGTPIVPFALPPPPALGDAEWYFLARYGPGQLCDGNLTTDYECCGLLREYPYLYALARGDSRKGYVECEKRLVLLWRGADELSLRRSHKDALARCLAYEHSYPRVGGRRRRLL